MSDIFSPCPFCGSAPTLSDVEERDDRRYMVMELGCCSTMTASIGYGRFKDMTHEEIRNELIDKLAEKWNSRTPRPENIEFEKGGQAENAKSFEFDSFPNKVGKVVLKESQDDDSIVLDIGGEEIKLIEADRDQWGVFLTIGRVTIAQEDGTRSFIDALSKALNELKLRNEFETTEATEV